MGRVIGTRYEVLERLGEGALFQVAKARDRTLSRIVALKWPQPQLAHDPAFCAALKQAASGTAGLVHPNIARLTEVAENDGAPLLVTEFVRGMDLRQRLRRIAPVQPSLAVDFAVAIAEALQHAHANGVVHGDLRPQNVMISPEGAVKVTDFGIASVLASNAQARANNLASAAYYQAPEVATGGPPTTAADVYALGAILFEMLTGRVPYPGETPVVVAMRQQNEPVPSPRALNNGVPRSLDGVVMKALQPRPADRYASVTDLLNDLKAIRDALRFGKPLSWNPLDREQAAAPSEAAAPPRATPAAEPAAATPRPVIANPGVARMPPMAGRDDSLPAWLRVMLYAAMVLFLVAVVAGSAIWLALLSKPPENRLPNLVGMRLEDALKAAGSANVRLIEHREFSDRYPADTVFRMDVPAGQPVAAGRSVNVWVSRGSRMVWVPDLKGLSAEDAERKLREAGLTLGAVDRAFDDDVPYNAVVSQNPRAGKRVPRDLAVALTLSDGPKNPDAVSAPDEGSGSFGSVDETPRTMDLEVEVKRDGQGLRRVRIEYDDDRGTHQTVDEVHGEGEVIQQKVEVYGRSMRVRVFYGDSPIPVQETTLPVRGRSR